MENLPKDSSAANDNISSTMTQIPSVAEPPMLQVMVSDSELWLINERNTTRHQKHDEIVPINHDDDAKNNLGPNSDSRQEDTIASEACHNRRVDIVLTDVKAHNYTVVFKECYNSTQFLTD